MPLMNRTTKNSCIRPFLRKPSWVFPFFALFLAAFFLLTGPAMADDATEPVPVTQVPEPNGEEEDSNKLSGQLEFDFNSGYLWRGLSFSKKRAFQPCLELYHGPWSGWVWGNYLMEEEVNKNQFNEVEYHLAREWSIGSWTLSPFITWNTYPNLEGQQDSHEIGLEAAYPVILFTKEWSLGFLGAVDQKDFHGAVYGEASLSKDWKLSSRSELSGKLWTGFGSPKFTEGYTGVRRSGLYVVGADISVVIRLSRQWFLRPHLETCKITSRDMRETTGDEKMTNVGLAIGWEFP